MASTIMNQIGSCLDKKEFFLLSGGAGSGKTYTLVQTLHHVFNRDPKVQVACITYTNVAAKEIKERSPYLKLHVSTIHDFLWDEIKEYQKNLKQAVIFLASEDMTGDNKLSYSEETSLSKDSFDLVRYKNYRKLEQGIITHDDVLKIANYMFSTYPLLQKILCDKYDYIFIDEYQDTQHSVIQIFLEHIKKASKNSLCIGFFGDRMQSIYDTGVGDIQSYIESGDVHEIIKDDNYRCAVSVIGLLNHIRSDIEQKPAKKKTDDGSIANKLGSITFLYSDADFDLNTFQASRYALKWDFNNYAETKVLFLTHKLSASRLGFIELLSAYSIPDRLIGNEPDQLAQHLLKIGGILYYFDKKQFAYVIDNIHRKIQGNADKQQISSALTRLYGNLDMSIEHMVNEFDKVHFVIKDDKFREYIEKYEDAYEVIKVLPATQILAYFIYYNRFSPYSTQHGIKGAEFSNVLVVMDNGRWNKYNFKYYFEKTPTKDSIIKRTESIFYVCCSRAEENLVVYYSQPTPQIIEQAKVLFGEENVNLLS